MADSRLDPRRQRELLEQLGARAGALEELLGYLDNPYAEIAGRAGELPLPEEPQIPFWRRYEREAAGEGGVPAVLRRRFPQLCFPIAEGLAEDPEYRAATRRGIWDPERADRLELERPQGLELSVDEGAAGPVPVLIARHRPDFERLVQALTCRNRPEPVPAAMGACLVKGLADWERVASYRAEWERGLGRSGTEQEWAAEMGSGLAPRKQLWQDRLILLSDGPYSAVSAAEVDLAPEAWRERSLTLRRAHESFHYLTLRLVGTIRSHLLDELIADFAGVTAAFGRYDARLALRFLGLDRLPEIRPEGRLAVYRGALSDDAVEVLARLLERAAAALERLGADASAAAAPPARILVALAVIGLDGIAAEGFAARFEAAFAAGDAA